MSWLLILSAPIWGAFIVGAQRVLRARMQRRKGPPLLQPFYDMAKLIDKRTLIIHSFHAVLALVHFLALWAVVGLIFFGWNMLYIIFLHLFASVILIMAGFSVRSIYSHIGANRELLAIVGYEPILLLAALAFFLASGSFEVAIIFQNEPLLIKMPLVFLALVVVVAVKTSRSPFDMSEAHQEIVGGIEIEYSGLFYEIIYMSKFMEHIFVYSFVFLFGGSNIWLGVGFVLFAFLFVNAVDNATARLKPSDFLRIIYFIALPMVLINIAGLLI